MRTVGCGLLAVAALLGPAPLAAAADAGPNADTNGRQAVQQPEHAVQPEGVRSTTAPENEVSLVAVTLTAGGALAAAGSGIALAVTRRRAVSHQPSRGSG